MRSKTIQYSEAVNKLIENQQIDSIDIANFLMEGDVDFGRSDTRSKPCKTYYIDGNIDDASRVLKVKNCPETLEIIAIED